MDNKPEINADSLVAELATDGIVMTKEESRDAVERLAELLLLISAPLPLPPPRSERPAKADSSLLRDE